MHKDSKVKILTSCSLLLLAAVSMQLTAFAKEPPANLQPLEDIPPPTIANDDKLADEPVITVVKKKGQTIEEYRLNGQLYMIKVTPEHGVPYFMHKEDQNGGWLMDGPSPPLSIPKWTIFRF